MLCEGVSLFLSCGDICHPAKMSQPLMSVAGHDWEEKFFLYGKRGPWVAMTGGGLSTGMIVAVLCVEEVVEG